MSVFHIQYKIYIKKYKVAIKNIIQSNTFIIQLIHTTLKK